MPRTVVAIVIALIGAARLAAPPVGTQATELPAAYIGEWGGTAAQVNPTAVWPIMISLTGGAIGSVVGTIDYPGQRCGGELTLARVDADDGPVELTEHLTFGEGVCVDEGTVVLEALADGSLEFQWRHLVVDSPASGTVVKAADELSTAATSAPALRNPEQSRSAVTFDIEEGVSGEDEAYIREGTRLAQDYYPTLFDSDLQDPVTIEVRASDPAPRFVAMAGGDRIAINTSHPIWIEQFMPLRRTQDPVHEYYHLLQEDWSRKSLSRTDIGPTWLMEGSAEYVAFLPFAEKGLLSYDDVRAYHMANVAFDSALPQLQELEAKQAFLASPSSAYSLGALASEILVADRGPRSLRDFYERIGQGDQWEVAFATAFGQSP